MEGFSDHSPDWPEGLRHLAARETAREETAHSDVRRGKRRGKGVRFRLSLKVVGIVMFIANFLHSSDVPWMYHGSFFLIKEEPLLR